MSERLRSILAVAVLTLTIWVWADIEQTVPGGEHDMPVLVTVPANSGYVVRDVVPRRIRASLRGPSGQLAELKKSQEDMACKFFLTDAQLHSGTLPLRAADGFQHLQRYRVDAIDVLPSEIRVDLARQVAVKVPVRVQVTGATLGEPATSQPADVMATVAETDLAALPEAQRYAVASLAITTVPESQLVDRDVALDKRLGGPDGIEATFDPPAVKVLAHLESPVIKTSLGRFPITVGGPPDILNRYQIVFPEDADRFVELNVQGPRPEVEKLTAQGVRVELVVTADTKPVAGAWIPGHPVAIGLPPTVKVVGDLPTVNFNLVEKKVEEAPAKAPKE
jgi:hypothetical protein